MATYLFDFDGTLVDSMSIFAEVMLKMLDEGGVEYPDNVLKLITPMGMQKTVEYFIELGMDMPAEQIAKKMGDYFIDEYTHRIPAKEGVIETLEVLRARGDSLNILTASPHITLDPCLNRLGIYDMFDNVWSCDADFGKTKTDPQIYRDAADRIGVAVEDMIFIDDNLYADIAGKQSGAVVYGIYDPSSAEYEQQIRDVTDRYIRVFSELLEL